MENFDDGEERGLEGDGVRRFRAMVRLGDEIKRAWDEISARSRRCGVVPCIPAHSIIAT